MALAEDGCGDLEGFTGDCLGGPSAAVDERLDIEDGNATDHGITWGLELGLDRARSGREGWDARAAMVGFGPF